MIASELAALYRRDLTRLVQQVDAFEVEGLLWETAPGVGNSAGNLALHLEGNLREYIGRQLGAIPYERVRPLEFSTRGVPQADLLTRLHSLKESIPAVLEGLPPERFDDMFPENVLGLPLTVRQFVIHLYGHLNYHLGQMDYLRRVLTGRGAIDYARL